MTELIKQVTDFANESPAKAGLIAAGLALAGVSLYKATRPKATIPLGSVVLITGCDSGIANATAKLLSAQQTKDGEPEFKVLAGCLTRGGIEELKSLGRANLLPFDLDVTSDDSARNMAQFAEEQCGDKGLFAIYNIAGINGGGYSDLTTMEEWRRVFEVNFFGIVRCTEAVFHLIHKCAYQTRLANARGENLVKPKVITISSVASELPIPGAAPYTASKHAAKGFCNALRGEVAAFGIDVVEVRPFFVATNIVPQKDGTEGAKMKKSLVDKFGDPGPRGNEIDPFGKENPLNRYVGGADALVERAVEGMLKNLPDRDKMMTPDYIARKMMEQMRSAKPKTHIICTERLGDTFIYNFVKHFPETAFQTMAKMAEKQMERFAKPLPVAEEAQKVSVEEKAKLVPA